MSMSKDRVRVISKGGMRGGKSCCVDNCYSNSSCCRGVSFHCLPKEEKGSDAEAKEKNAWRDALLHATGRPENWNPSNCYICSRHFDDSCFEWRGTKKCLKMGGLPTKNLPGKSYPTQELTPKQTDNAHDQGQEGEDGQQAQEEVEGAEEEGTSGGNRRLIIFISADGDVSTRIEQKEQCCVKSCSKKKLSTDDNVSHTKIFFPFPREKARCRKWAKNCGRPELLQKSALQLRNEGWKVCSDHFDSSQFQFSSLSSKRLTPDAVPNPVFKTKPREKKVPVCKRPRLTLTEAEKEPLPQVKLEMDYAEDPTLCWRQCRLGTEVAGISQPHNVGRQPLDISLEPQNFGFEPLGVKRKPDQGHAKRGALDIKTEAQDCESVDIKREAQDCESVDIKKEAQDCESVNIKKEAQDCESVNIKKEAQDCESVNIKKEAQDCESVNIKKEAQDCESVDIKTEAQDCESVDIKTEAQDCGWEPPVTFEAVEQQQSPSATTPVGLTLVDHDIQGWTVSVNSQFDENDVEDNGIDDYVASSLLSELKKKNQAGTR